MAKPSALGGMPCPLRTKGNFSTGVPVLYTTNPAYVIFAARGETPADTPSSEGAITGAVATFNPRLGAMPPESGAPSVVVERTRAMISEAKYKVALIDIDAKVGFLSDFATLLNSKQSYYNFEVVYLAVPSGYVRTDLGPTPQTFVPRLKQFFDPLSEDLEVDFVCGLTQNPIADDDNGKIVSNYFSSTLDEKNETFFVSTFDLRRYAQEANTSFTKAVFSICFGMLVACDKRWHLDFHDETVGCIFDLCDHRDDIVAFLKKMKFDHETCRSKIEDVDQLRAIDQFLEIEFKDV